MKKVYISGGITGVENYEQHFKDAEDMLKMEGFKPVNPVTLEHNHDQSWEQFMKVDLKALLDCDMIFMLENWGESNGANIERSVAKICGIEVLNG